MFYRKWTVCGLAAVAGLSLAQAASSNAPPTVAPGGGQMVAGSFIRVIVPEGWNWAQNYGRVKAASPNAPPVVFTGGEEPHLTDDMAYCLDLSREQESPGAAQERLNEIVADFHEHTTEKLGAIGDAAARAASFVELRQTGGGVKMMVGVFADGGADQFGAEFTGDVYTETPKGTIHFVCKTVLSSDKGAYPERTAMKAMIQLVSSLTPL